MKCKNYRCPECGDRLIHQEKRGMNESASALGQYIHDNYPNTFWFMDVDGIVYKKLTQVLRILERKKTHDQLRPSQQFLLPILSIGIHLLVCVNQLNKESGVFVVLTDPPFQSAIVRKVEPYISLKLGEAIHLDGEDLKKFYTADRMQTITNKAS